MVRQYAYQNLLREAFNRRTKRNVRFSLRAFAASLKIGNSTLSHILSGKRLPSREISLKLISKLELSPSEKDTFLRSVATAKHDHGLLRIEPEFRALLKNKPVSSTTEPPKELSIDLWKTIADWHHSAILELTLTKDFISDPKWISEQLETSLSEVHLAIERLIRLGLLELKTGKLTRCPEPLLSGDRHLTSAAHRRRQKQVLEKSIQSLENDPLTERNHTAMTFAIDSSKIPEAKMLTEKFMNEMTTLLETGERDRVYELVVNLFPLQIKPNFPERKSL
jgi:uncharacterized protein (TIGR02147 family)